MGKIVGAGAGAGQKWTDSCSDSCSEVVAFISQNRHSYLFFLVFSFLIFMFQRIEKKAQELAAGASGVSSYE
jgi:hypothetical protein